MDSGGAGSGVLVVGGNDQIVPYNENLSGHKRGVGMVEGGVEMTTLGNPRARIAFEGDMPLSDDRHYDAVMADQDQVEHIELFRGAHPFDPAGQNLQPDILRRPPGFRPF